MITRESAQEMMREARAEAIKGSPEEGAMLAGVRRQLAITQRELAKASGVSLGVIASIETRKQKATAKLMDKLWPAVLKIAEKRPAGHGLDRLRQTMNGLTDAKLAEQEVRIGRLEEEVRDLRSLYEAATKEALAHETYAAAVEEYDVLNEKLSGERKDKR